MLEDFFENKFEPFTMINFLNFHRRKIKWAIFAIVAFYGGFLLYYYLFKIEPRDLGAGTGQVNINKNVYNEIWRDFSERPARSQKLMEKEYNNPFLNK